MSVESAFKALSVYHSLTRKDFDKIVSRHGIESENVELISLLIDDGWTYCVYLEEEYVHNKPPPPPWNRLTAILRDT